MKLSGRLRTTAPLLVMVALPAVLRRLKSVPPLLVMAALPAVGSWFLGFHLLEELGRGAFGTVYLAEQGDLANRPVALKVAADILAESHTLAQPSPVM